MLQNPGVNQAFVIHREDAEIYLVAYIVSEKGMMPTVSQLRAGLTALLPDYMVPKAFVFLELYRLPQPARSSAAPFRSQLRHAPRSMFPM